jgi:tyrosyl-tRNA synthetase
MAVSGMVSSKGEARRLLQQGGLSINNIRISEPMHIFQESDLVEGRLALLRSGKKNFFLLKV